MRRKALNFIVQYKVYPFDVMVSIGETDTDLEKKLVKHVVTDRIDLTHSPTQQGRCIMFTGNQTLIRLYRYPTTASDYGHLQHEIFHAVTFLFDVIGIKLCHDSDEAFAYLIDYLTANIYERLWT